MNDLDKINTLIYEIRGQRVMLDRDLASLYGVETSQLKRAVRRNIKRFEGDDFMFELTKDEISRCQIGTLNEGRGNNFKYMPFAFTELGVAMLSSVLRSETAIEINRAIMRAFVEIRRMLTESKTDRLSSIEVRIEKLETYMEEVLMDQNDINEETRLQLELINESLAELQSQKPSPKRPKIGYI
ncbi:MAG: ORF6N domain-containing protein [Paramuribaculum sp.]|nr:ORF6N domain-containing protein [Paramuribaculum sp.]